MPPVLGFIGKPDCGKTTLIVNLIPALAAQGVRVGTIKHHHGDIQMDTPGKDTWRHKQAGAQAVLLASPTGLGFIRDVAKDPAIEILVEHYFQDLDLVLAEGYKDSLIPQIEVFRSAVHSKPMLNPGKNLIATVSDVAIRPGLPRFTYDETDSLIQFILKNILQR